MNRIYPGIVAAALLGGCVDDSQPKLDLTDVVTPDGLDPDGAPEGATTIAYFRTNFDSISRGPDSRDVEVDGFATLEWKTTGAETVEVLVDGLPIALDGCVQTGIASCAVEGSLKVRPSQDTSFTLRAVGAGGTCEGACPEETVAVAVKPPVRVFVDYESDTVEPGTDVMLPFVVENATSFTFGIVGNDAEGLPMLSACADAANPGDAPCTIEVTPDSDPVAGVIHIPSVQRNFKVGVTAENGAADGVGDLSLGDLDYPFAVPVVVHAFTATPEAFLPGEDVVLSWDIGGAQSVSVTTDSTAFSGLSTCVGLGADGTGFCTLTANAAAQLGTARFILTALQDTGMSGEAQTDVEIIGGPRVGAFSSSLGNVVPGQPIELTWKAFAADAVAITANPAVVTGLDACTGLAADGSGSCLVSVAAGTSAGDVDLTLTASNTAVGPAATDRVTLSVAPAPVVTSFGFDDATRLAGSLVTLQWTTVEAESLVLQAGSSAISQRALDACTESAAAAASACALRLPNGLPAGEIAFTLVAVGPTGARSEVATAVLTIGEVPAVDFTGTPDMLPEGGGDVSLAWVAATATRVVIMDSASEPNTIVDTDVGTACVSTEPCDPAGDAVAVAVAQPTTFTLVATNDFGETLVTTAVSLEGAPFISDFRVNDNDVTSGPIGLDGTTAGVSWTVENLDATDRVILERAVSAGQDGNCAAIAANAWSTETGFPMVGSTAGTASLSNISMTALCFRFIAEDTATNPPQRDVVTFKLYRKPSVTSFDVADATRRLGDTVDLAWETDFAHEVAVTVSPVGAVTSQDLARCVAGDGACSVTIQAGTPLGEVVFSLVGIGEAGSETAPSTVAVTIGNGATIENFSVNPGSLTAAGDVTLSWTTLQGTSVAIRNATAEVFTSSTAATVASGSHVVTAVGATTTWTLTVENSFGSESAQVTTFVGASIDSLTVNGGSALDGEESIITGPVTISWSTTSADGSHRLESAPAPGDSNCNAGGLTWTTRYLKDDAPADSASHSDGVLTANRCYRLTVANTQTPPQSSTAIFLVRDVPEVLSLVTSPSTIGTSGGTVIIDADVRGATTLTMTAEYRDASGGVLGTRDVCTQSTLNEGSLSGTANVDSVSCAHRIVACNFLCLNNGMPGDTATVRYLLTVADQERDAASLSSAGGEDVTVD